MAGERYDAIVIGSGFGGSMAAHVLVHAGLRVLMLERGDWLVRGPHNWETSGVIDLAPEYSAELGYPIEGERRGTQRALFCVGGMSVFYGGVSLRLREHDFEPHPEIAADQGIPWPFDYAELEPFYTRAERILGVAGQPEGNGGPVGADPTAPPRSAPYPHAMPALSNTSSLIGAAAARLGLHPFQLPLAINHAAGDGRAACIGCLTCDAFPCAIGAKNDLATAVLPPLVARGLRIEPNTVALRLIERAGRIARVECVDRRTLERRDYAADQVILAAGALGSPHLLLASGLHARNPAGELIGRFLMRHCNGIVYGLFPFEPNPERRFHKQVAIHDLYFGHAGVAHPTGKLGSIQQVHSPPVGLAQLYVPRLLRRPVPWLVDRMTGLLVIAEDQPRRENRVVIDDAALDAFGMPRMRIRHRYTPRDRAARRALLRTARAVLRAAGARFFYVHTIHTFSHAVGTVRMGVDPRTAPLDDACRFRGIGNLRVIDGSFMPASGGLNPSLTIAANALRAAEHLVRAA
jgi:choline dehydrogenase-like flavoprotein